MYKNNSHRNNPVGVINFAIYVPQYSKENGDCQSCWLSTVRHKPIDISVAFCYNKRRKVDCTQAISHIPKSSHATEVVPLIYDS